MWLSTGTLKQTSNMFTGPRTRSASISTEALQTQTSPSTTMPFPHASSTMSRPSAGWTQIRSSRAESIYCRQSWRVSSAIFQAVLDQTAQTLARRVPRSMALAMAVAMVATRLLVAMAVEAHGAVLVLEAARHHMVRRLMARIGEQDTRAGRMTLHGLAFKTDHIRVNFLSEVQQSQ